MNDSRVLFVIATNGPFISKAPLNIANEYANEELLREKPNKRDSEWSGMCDEFMCAIERNGNERILVSV